MGQAWDTISSFVSVKTEKMATKLSHSFNNALAFTFDSTLRNNITGRTLKDSVKIQKRFNIQEVFVKSLVGKEVLPFSYKLKNRVKTLASCKKLKISNNDKIAFDLALLFQCLIPSANNGGTMP